MCQIKDKRPRVSGIPATVCCQVLMIHRESNLEVTSDDFYSIVQRDSQQDSKEICFIDEN